MTDMRKTFAPVLTVLAAVSASPALAAGGPFLSLHNTNFIVLLAFILFIAVLVYLKVPGMLGRALDKRAAGIKSELDEARALREEAQTILAGYERKQREVKEQADRIVAAARVDAATAAEQAKADLKQSIARRLAAAVKEVRDRAVAIAVAAAGAVLAKQMTAAQANSLIDDAISQVDAKLH